jgi:threonine synthase
MDVGNPSNMERLRALYPEWGVLRSRVSAASVDDAAIAARIRADFDRYGREWCPHTATAAEVYAGLPLAERQERPWVLVATAHPAKFNEIVEPLIRKAVAVPDSLARLLKLPRQCIDAAPTLHALAAAL